MPDDSLACKMGFQRIPIENIGLYPSDDRASWPVRRKRLFCYRDERSLNANEETEFLGDIIQEANETGFHVQLMTNCGIWNPERIVRGYPRSRPQLNRKAVYDGIRRFL